MSEERDGDKAGPEAELESSEANRRAIIYSVALGLSFILLSVGFTLYAFPGLSVSRAIGAGVFFGGFLALCSITYSAF